MSPPPAAAPQSSGPPADPAADLPTGPEPHPSPDLSAEESLAQSPDQSLQTAPPAPARRRTGPFIATKEYRRFVEFADAVRRQSDIGLCFGPAGVGKTLSARRYTHWDRCEDLLETWGPRSSGDSAVYAALARSRAVFYTPTTTCTLRQLIADLDLLVARVDVCVEQHLDQQREQHTDNRAGRGAQRAHHTGRTPRYVDLLVIDEADRLAPAALEHLRDRFDRRALGLLLIGMPGIDRRLSRYPQLYSRIGFAHTYRPLGQDELAFVLARHWRKLGLTLDLEDFTDGQAVAAISRITSGNFRLLQRLFVQVERVMKINGLGVITSDVIEAARSVLVIGET